MGLGGGQPRGEFAGEVLDEDADEALHAAEGCAVNHHGAVLLAIRAGVFEFESLGQVVVDLDGAQLPFSAEDVTDDEVDLGSVEGGFALLLDEVNAER